VTYAFDTDTAITRVNNDTWTTHLDPKWSINVVPNGGYSGTSIVRAMLEATEREHPLSVTTHFYKTCEPDSDATVHAQLLRAGSRSANASGTLSQDGITRSHSVAVLGSLPEPTHEEVNAPAPPDLPPLDDCFVRRSDEHSGQGFPIPLADMIEMRLDRELGTGGSPEFGAWMRFADERPSDPLALILFADSLPPAPLIVRPNIGWVPTLELTVHVRRKPVDGWIRASVSSHDMQGSLLVENVFLWDESDALVCQARQLAMLLR
jgi:acyl-CoA thioesterase